MNCTWPIAPAHDPSIFGNSMSPRLRISRASSSSRWKSVDRRGSHASVASAATVGRVPLKRPKFDSIPQIDSSSDGGTPYVALISSSRS